MTSNPPSPTSKARSNKLGILVGCDESQEWLLAWWWKNYSRYNDFPVAFADFGMSEEARLWCAERGVLISLNDLALSITKKEELTPELADLWEKAYPDLSGKTTPIWQSREAWFKKPLSFLRSPFDVTIWIDLDCEILGSIEPIFDHIDSASGVGLVPEPYQHQEWMEKKHLLLPGEISYNSGVVVYRKDSPLIAKWAEWSAQSSGEFHGDQDVLSRLIYLDQWQINELPLIYNWRITQGLNLATVIMHWSLAEGKRYIREKGGIGAEFEEYKNMINRSCS